MTVEGRGDGAAVGVGWLGGGGRSGVELGDEGDRRRGAGSEGSLPAG